MDVCLAVDIGGTKVAVGLVTGDGRLLAHRRAPTPQSPRADDLFAVVADLVRATVAEAPTPPLACGVGCGGPMDLERGTVSPLNIPAWRAFPLRTRLEQLTGLPVRLDNDAKAFALAEGWTGAAAGSSHFLAMVVSTGVGGGVVLDGRLLHGASGNAGHVGHVIVVPDGRPCGCGAHGCLEAEASGSAIARFTGRPPAEADAELVRRTGRLVGQAVGSVTNLLDLDLAVVGGSVALGFGAPFFDAALDELRARARLSFSSATRLVASTLGPGGPVLGAGALAWQAAAPGTALVS